MLKDQALPAHLVTYGLTDQLNPDDSRQSEFQIQRAERGFDDTELWNLDITFAKFIIPRLKAFNKINNSCPAKLCYDKDFNKGLEDWHAIINSMIHAFELVADNDFYDPDEPDGYKTAYKTGMDNFVKYWLSLWW